MKEMTVQQLKEKIDNKEDISIIDVREEYEFEIVKLDADLIPLGTILESADLIPRDKPVIIYCRSGARSASAVKNLENKFGFENLYNLKGGILAYAREIDPSLPTY